MRDGSDDARTVPLGVENLRQARRPTAQLPVHVGRQQPAGERVGIAIPNDGRGGHVLGDRDHPLAADLAELPRRLRDRNRGHRE